VKKKDIIKGIIVLLSVTLLSGYLLAQVYSLTKPKIEQQKKIEEERLNRDIFEEGVKFSEDNLKEIPCTAVYDINGNLIGRIFTSQVRGYGGNITIKVGFDNELKIVDVKILEHTETPGLGSKITDSNFIGQFKNKQGADLYLKTDSPTGQVDGITGATISSRAVTEGIRKLQEQLQ